MVLLGEARRAPARARLGIFVLNARLGKRPLGYQRCLVILSGAWRGGGVSPSIASAPQIQAAPPRMHGTKSSLVQILNCGPPGVTCSKAPPLAPLIVVQYAGDTD